MTEFAICETPQILRIIYFIKIVINIVKTVVPIALIVMITIECVKGVINNDQKLGNIVKLNMNKILSAILIFAVPTLIDITLEIIDEKTDYKSCWVNAEKTSIEKYQLLWDENEKRKEEEEKNNNNNNNNNVGTDTGSNSNNNSNNNSNSKPISIAKVNTTDIGCTLYYDPYKKIKKDYLYFQSGEAEKIHTALKGACTEVNKRSYMSYLQTAGSYVRKNTSSEHSYHAKALAVDLNNLFTFTKNGKTYHPYMGQGETTWNNYKKFICEVCNGKENCEYNINYIIYEKYFKPIGWCWGGYFSKKYFDPMHFEKRTGGCATSNKVEITC